MVLIVQDDIGPHDAHADAPLAKGFTPRCMQDTDFTRLRLPALEEGADAVIKGPASLAQGADDALQVPVEHDDLARLAIGHVHVHADPGFEAVDVLGVAAQEFVLRAQRRDEVVGGGGLGRGDHGLELTHEGVEEARGRGVLEEGRVKQILPLEHGGGVALLDEVVQALGRAKVLWEW